MVSLGASATATKRSSSQENVIEQMGSGLAGWRMPVAEFDGNCAWLEIARLAWHMGKWIAQLVLLTAKSATQPAARCPVEDLRPM